MANTTLRMEVLIGTAQFPDTAANRAMVFVVGSRLGAQNPGFGNINVPNAGRFVGSGAIFAKVDQPGHFSSADLTEHSEITGQLANLIERGFIKVSTDAAPGTALTRAALELYL